MVPRATRRPRPRALPPKPWHETSRDPIFSDLKAGLYLMTRMQTVVIALIAVVVAAVRLPAWQAPASPAHAKLFSDMRWRNIGPLRAGRTKAVAGVPSQPFTFYIGMVNGGVWKTTNAGRTWTPIFEDQSTACVGAY